MKLTTTLTNPSDTPCLMLRLKVTGNKSGERILPFFTATLHFADARRIKTITMSLKRQDTRGERPVVELTGFNYEP